MIRIRVLGPAEAEVGGGPADLGSRRQRAVLAVLTSHRGRAVSSDRLIEDVWHGKPPQRPLISVHAYVSHLRRVLEPHRPPRAPASVLLSSAQGYCLRLPDDAVDAWRFEDAVHRSRTQPAHTARQTLHEALSWWRGAAYGEFTDGAWAAAEAHRLDELRAAAQELLVAAILRTGGAGQAVPSAAALVKDHPLREEGWRLLTLALWGSGSRGEALSTLRRCRRVLREELGLDPGQALGDLEQALLVQDAEVLHAAVAPAPADAGSVRLPGRPVASAERRPSVPEALVGREEDLLSIEELLTPHRDAAQVAVFLGEPGVGKSALLAAAAQLAADRGIRVLRLRSAESEHDLAFAGLHQLLRPLLSRAADLPARHGTALRQAFGLAEPDHGGEPTARLYVSLAAQTLLCQAAAENPLALLVDDGQWVDPASLEVLSFLARRVDGEPISLLLTARGALPPPGFTRDVTTRTLAPLSAARAAELLDRQPDPPQGATRQQILDLAAGNPLALIELARAAADRTGVLPTTPAPWQTPGLALTTRLTSMFATHLTQLPAPTQQALLLAAVCDTGELGLLPAPYTDPDVWQPAADRGLVQLTGDHVQFRHPLMRSAVYHSAPAERRRAAHRDLAARPQLTPDRQAWHLAAAASGTDEQAATALEATADRALRRSASTEALTAMERAAQLSATPRTRAQRLMRTAYLATYQERAAYVSDLATRIAALTDDPDITFQLTLLRGWAAFARNRPTEAIRILLPAARALAPLDPDTARSALVTAVTAALFSGIPAHRDQVLAATAEFDTGHPDDAVTRLYAQAMCRPHHEPHRQHEELQRLLTTTKPDMRITWLLSGVAAIHDLPDPFHPVPSVLTDPDHPDTENAGNRLRVSSLGWLAFHQGRIQAAQTAVTRTADTPPGEEPGLADAQVHSLAGAVLALRGQTQEARRALHDALSVDAHPTGRVNIHARWALGLAAWADQDHEEAYRHLASAFTDDGRPQHYYQSYYCLAALAAAARHTGDAARIAHARTAVDQAVQQLADASSARLTQLLHHAQALLAHPTQDAETHYKYALADPLGEQWPFERACVRTDYGHWLRHANRTQEAREQLGRALAAFERLGARPWVAQIRMP